MKSKKATRRALFSSVMALILCCAMLVGSTFAWFTDSVSSVNNIIKSGNLDIELEYSTDFQTWAAVNSETNVFEKDTLWEPGHTEVVYLKVSNLGTLALKYELGVKIASETGSINVNDEEFMLSDHIQFGVVENVTAAYADREAAVAAVTNAAAINVGYTDGGYMAADADDLYLALVVWMPETVGNEANYKTGEKAPEIHLGVELLAYQKDYENDSFGPDYDAGLGTAYVSTYEELVDALTSGGTVKLTNDVEVSSTLVIPEGVTVVLDLGGNELNAVYQEGSTDKHIYAIDNYGNLTLLNGTVNARGIYNQNGARITVNGAEINALDYNGGACIWSYGTGEVYLNDAVLTGNTGVVYSEGYVEINGGTYTCYSGIADDGTQLTAPTYNIRAYNGLKITDGTFSSRHGVISVGGGEALIEGGSYTIQFASGTTSNVVYVYGDTHMTINGGDFISDDSADKADSGAAVLVSGSDAELDIYGGTFVGMNGMVSGNANTSLYGGTYNTVWDYNHYGKLENLLADGYTAIQNADDSWTVISEKYTTAVADGLYSDGGKAYAVTNGNGLAALNEIMGNAKAETTNATTIELLADIDMTGKSWSTIGWNKAYKFEGIIGNGHTISNMDINGTAMFANLNGTDVTISDLTFDNVTVSSSAINTSIIVGQAYTNLTLDNVDVVNSSITGGYKVAPLIATVFNEGSSTVTATLKNCDVSNTVVKATVYDFCTAGLVAFVNAGSNDKIEFENCTVDNVTLVAPYDDYKAHAFVYATGSSSLYNEADGVTVTNCSVQSYMDGTTTFAGGTLYLQDGTYVTAAEGEDALTITGDTTLVVEGEATLGGGKNGSGIKVAEGVTLTVIGGGNLEVYGNSGMEYEASGNYCEFDVPSYDNAGGSGIDATNATVVIDGLTGLTAEGYGKGGFGIGGNGANVTIKNTTVDYVRGGFVNVTGNYNDAKYNKNEPEGGAAIGGAVIVIDNAYIKNAEGGSKSAGIGARFWQPTDVTITNSVIDMVVGGASSAGIGGSRVDEGPHDQNDDAVNTAQTTKITIVDSTITAVGGYYGAGIGSGYDTYNHKLDKAPMCTISISGKSVIDATGGKCAAGIGTGHNNYLLSGEITSDVTVKAVAGESTCEWHVTLPQNIGYGELDRDYFGTDYVTSFIVNGVKIDLPTK